MRNVPSREKLVRLARELDLNSSRLRGLRDAWSRAFRQGRRWSTRRLYDRIEAELARLARQALFSHG